VTGGAGTFTLADLPKLEENVPNRFRTRSVIFGNRNIANRARQFTAPNVSDVYEPISEAGYALWGYPFYEVSAMANVITAGSKILVQFDPAYYVIVDRIGIDVEITSNWLYQQSIMGTGSGFPTGQRGLLCFVRNSAKVLDAAAFRVLTT
jgi:HK97 family phage major capsid protein